VVASLVPDERRALIPGLLDLHFVRNVHGAMGLFGDRPLLLVSLALVVVGVLAFLLRTIVRRSPLAQVGFGLMLGGAFGNVVDRSLHQYVVDFISPRGFFVFNLGDACISLGLACVAVATWRLPTEAGAR
jgi:signal peptidase II